MSKTILVTGAAGFAGSHFCEHVLINTDWNIVALCRMSNVGDLNRLRDSVHFQARPGRVKFVFHDLKHGIPPHVAQTIGHPEYIAHYAASSDVNRSILQPISFLEDNVLGTAHLFEWARNLPTLERVISYNTDEIFGPAPDGVDWDEWDRWKPSNPYAASKAGQAAVDSGWFTTYGFPVITSQTMNLYGERQNPEKFIPKTIRAALMGAPIEIHSQLPPNLDRTSDESLVLDVGRRHWIHCRNAADATLFLLANGTPGDRYNVVGEVELTNLELVRKIHASLGIDAPIEFVDFHRARPGHDRRYSLSGKRLADLGWRQPISFDASLDKMIRWTVQRPEWLGLPSGVVGAKL